MTLLGQGFIVSVRLRDAASDGFDPDLHLQKIGLANQTTMLMSETLKVQETLYALLTSTSERFWPTPASSPTPGDANVF